MSQLHESAFQFLLPTAQQKEDMSQARSAAQLYWDTIHPLIPSGADKTYIARKLRTLAMWVNVSITRNADGSPRIRALNRKGAI